MHEPTRRPSTDENRSPKRQLEALAAAIDRAARDLGLAEEPSAFVAALEAGSEQLTRRD